MVDVPHALRIDLAHERELAAGVRHVGGEPRALQLYCEPGRRDRRARHLARAARRAGPGAHPGRGGRATAGSARSTRTCSPRIGDVVVAMRDNFAVVDSRTARPELLALLGLHGSLTHDEVSIPLLHAPARDSA